MSDVENKPKTREEVAREIDRVNSVIWEAIYGMQPAADPDCAAIAILQAGANVAVGCKMDAATVHSIIDGVMGRE